jgi:ATP-dependent RNA helicase DeaD
VATDVAARGIDLPKLELVVHAELPSSHETLLHRSGRTGRAGRKGVSALVVVPSARKKAERILKFAKLTAAWGAAPSAEDIEACDQQRMLQSDDWQAEITDGERGAVEQLVARFTPEQIAAAYLRQYKLRHSAPEELGAVSAGKLEPKKPRAAFGPSVWFSLSEGANQAASPRHLLPMICKAANLSKEDIGAIRIADDESYIEIREASVPGFLAAIGEGMTIEGKKQLQRLDKAPDLSAYRPGKPDHAGKSRSGPAKYERKPKTDSDAPEHRRKPRHGASSDAPPKRKQAKEERDPAVHAVYEKKRHGAKGAKPKSGDAAKPGQAGPSGKLDAKKPHRGAGKGPPPPKGKPNSKKNRARAAAKKMDKAGNAKPKRP